ncbi:MAG: prolyl-tRNA synthetase associated domain-containing protein [Gammaproteobacteria bacterium]|nr:prolyl-tRNA synthetase associated domain-containing protein [Gammaproteobacteria bacterium]
MREKIDDILFTLGCNIERYQHPPLPTSDAAKELCIERSGVQIKNLFLNDNYRKRHFLLLTTPEKKIDLKVLSKQLKVSRLGFASSRRLNHYLNGQPGHVSFLLLVNDQEKNVELLIDQDIWQAESLQAHPGINTETYVLSKVDVVKFLKYTGHESKIVYVPIANSEE